MPRYFFHVLNSKALIDNVGLELADLPAARRMAIRTAGEILTSEGDLFWKEGKWRMSVADGSGKICFTLDFSADTHDQE